VQERSVDDFVAAVRAAADAGFATAWTPQIFGHDALTLLALAGREVSGIGLGTAVVPTYPRHPAALAAQALTVQETTGGRLTLGVGLSHRFVIEGMFAMTFKRPVRHMSEYLSVLIPLVRDGQVAFAGETLGFTGGLDVPGAAPVPVVVAALGPRMLGLAGTVADGTITWMCGPKTVAGHIVPAITAAAEAAGRSAPQVVVCLPTAVTDDVATARDKAGRMFAVYGTLPSYRAMLDREGVDGPADVAVIGDEQSVRSQIEQIISDGATEFVASPFYERERTIGLLAELL
jgi:F420-dependent oxidoreductase-like protein